MAETIKVGILGMGRAGVGMHVREIAEYPDRFELVAVADHDPSRLENPPGVPAQAKRYASCEELIDDPAVELVSIALRHPEPRPVRNPCARSRQVCEYRQADRRQL